MPSCDIPNVISSISWVDVAQNPRISPVGGRNTSTVKLGCDGWYPITTYWDGSKLREQLDNGTTSDAKDNATHYWAETPGRYIIAFCDDFH